jgi:DNA polymerase III epsilon subunit-like protein
MIVLDIETSGTNPEKHSILSIGAIDFERPEQIFSEECHVWEGAHIELEALAINGFTEEQVKDPAKKSEEEIVKAFFSWIADREERTVVGQNPSFDVSFLQAAAHRYHLDFPLARRSIDIHSLVYFHMVRQGLTPPIEHHHSAIHSDFIMEYIGIPTEPKPHVAINGAIWEAEALSRLLYDKPLLAQFEKNPIPWLSNRPQH